LFLMRYKVFSFKDFVFGQTLSAPFQN
jgi:hypothetical protein